MPPHACRHADSFRRLLRVAAIYAAPCHAAEISRAALIQTYRHTAGPRRQRRRCLRLMFYAMLAAAFACLLPPRAFMLTLFIFSYRHAEMKNTQITSALPRHAFTI